MDRAGVAVLDVLGGMGAGNAATGDLMFARNAG
jgi:hypothetical protein